MGARGGTAATRIARQYLSIDEAAAWLGVSVASVRRYISRGELRGFRLPSSRLIFLRLTDLERFVAAGEIPTAQSRT